MRIAIVGAGMSGLTCADRLVAQGHAVTLYDKGRGPGGRLSTRRASCELGEVSFDHGAPWFNVRDLRFRRAVLGWEEAGLVTRWDAVEEEAWVGTPGMNSVIKHLAGHHNVFFGCMVHGIARHGDGWCVLSESTSMGPYDAVILAVPMEQAIAKVALHDLRLARLGAQIKARPCWTALFAFDRPLAAERDAYLDTGIFSHIVRNSAKPGRKGPESWVAYATADWSRTHLERDKQDVAKDLQAEFALALGVDLPPPVIAMAHRWRYACYTGHAEEALWNEDIRLGICGDWLMGGKVEGAWLSGKAMADQLQIFTARDLVRSTQSAG